MQTIYPTMKQKTNQALPNLITLNCLHYLASMTKEKEKKKKLLAPNELILLKKKLKRARRKS